MGVVYGVKCDKCGTEFNHQAGMGFSCTCRECGEYLDENSRFRCPVCNREFIPQTAEFELCTTSITLWD